MPEIAEMPDLSSAMDLLNAAEAAEQPIPATELTQPDPNAEPQATPAATDGNQEAPNPSPTDTPTAADKPAEATEKKTVETPPKPGDNKPKSKFAEDAQRRDTSWKKLNEEKAAFKLEQDRITAERNAITFFSEWDGESYEDKFFCNGDHAKRFAYVMAGVGRVTVDYAKALAAQTAKV